MTTSVLSNTSLHAASSSSAFTVRYLGMCSEVRGLGSLQTTGTAGVQETDRSGASDEKITALGMTSLSPRMKLSLTSAECGWTGFLDGLPSDEPTSRPLFGRWNGIKFLAITEGCI